MRQIWKLPILAAAIIPLILLGSCGGEDEPPAVTPSVIVTAAPTAEPPILVNALHPIPENYNVDLTKLSNGQSVATECYAALTDMLSHCEAAGLHPDVCSGYRSIVYQSQLFERKIGSLTQAGHSRKMAEQLAATEVARPGTSEHHTGLAVDIVDSSNYNLDESQESTPAQQWLLEHCWEYGFILRYPKDKSDITGIIYEPWHYRYVGTDISLAMRDSGQCLEEYLGV